MDDVLPEIEFLLSDPSFTGHNFLEYFPDPDDRLYYGEKILDFTNAMDTLADKLMNLDSETRDKYNAQLGNLSRFVEMKKRGEL